MHAYMFAKGNHAFKGLGPLRTPHLKIWDLQSDIFINDTIFFPQYVLFLLFSLFFNFIFEVFLYVILKTDDDVNNLIII